MDETATKVTETTSVRLHLDLRMVEPHNARDLKFLADEVEEYVHRYVDLLTEARVTQIIPAEGECFDWAG